ncbi:MAG: hypothetical protein JL50_11335 [Peptococcaceae bacterium BICA1-7]|nr:MAG: hypothetical protein JL50_11335 [Peptococcaceae bacterium BICA1-7]
MKVCVIGLGYIGFPTACVAAEAGHRVVGVDVNREIINRLSGGDLHITNEDGLAELAGKVFESGLLTVQGEPEKADIFIIAVPTPCRKKEEVEKKVKNQIASSADGSICNYNTMKPTSIADLSFVEQATRSILPFLEKENLIIVESTISPGTTVGLVCNLIEDVGFVCGRDIFLAHAPERVLPGNILTELKNNNRIVGGIGSESGKKAKKFYSTFVKGEIVITDSTTAEMVKLMENTYRDVNIALANEFALIAEHVGIDVFEAISLANRHPRVNLLTPGPGVGGHCIAVDPYFIIEIAPEISRLISLSRAINSGMPHHVVELVKNHVSEKAKKVVILGASYKANVGDERESPSLVVASLLTAYGFEVLVHDPYITKFNKPIDEMVRGADVIVLLTDHNIYKELLNPVHLSGLMRCRYIVDTRNFFSPQWEAAGFNIKKLGVRSINV